MTNKPGRISFFKNEDGSYEKFIDQGIGHGEFLYFNSQDVTEKACKKLCKEMPGCVESTLWVAADGSTEAPQCRFSTTIGKTGSSGCTKLGSGKRTILLPTVNFKDKTFQGRY